MTEALQHVGDGPVCTACGAARPSLEAMVGAALAMASAIYEPASRTRGLTERLRELGIESELETVALQAQAGAAHRLLRSLRSALAVHKIGLCGSCAARAFPGMCGSCTTVAGSESDTGAGRDGR